MIVWWLGWFLLAMAGAYGISRGLVKVIEWLEERGW